MIRKNLIKEKKGISPIIATLLLILIAIAAGVIVYAYVVGFLGSSSPSAPQVGSDQLDVNAVQYSSTSGNMTVYVQNVGQSSFNVSSIYLYYVNNTLYKEVSPSSGNPVKAGTTSSIVATVAALPSGQTYYVKVTTLVGSSAVSSTFKT